MGNEIISTFLDIIDTATRIGFNDIAVIENHNSHFCGVVCKVGLFQWLFGVGDVMERWLQYELDQRGNVGIKFHVKVIWDPFGFDFKNFKEDGFSNE